MKKRQIAVAMAAAMLLASGCSSKDPSAKTIENEHIRISQYDGIEITKVADIEEPTEEDIEDMMTMVIQQNATFEDVDRAAEMGDFATVDFTGKVDGKEFDDGSATDFQVEIGAGNLIDGMEESLIGHKAGDTYSWDGTFPKDMLNEDLSGKDVTFDIEVKLVQEQKLPEINDKFVQSVSTTSKTVAEYQEELKKAAMEDLEYQYENAVMTSAWNAVMEKSEVKKFPKGRVDELTEKLIQNYKEQAKVYEMDYEEFLEQYMQTSVEDFEKQAAESAEFLAKQELMVDAIMEEEKIELSDKEYQAHLEEVVAQYGYESTDELIEDAGEEDLKFTAKLEKVQKWVGEHCVQVEADDEVPVVSTEGEPNEETDTPDEPADDTKAEDTETEK